MWNFSHGAYIEATISGFPVSGVKIAAASVPKRLTANSHGRASAIAFASSHSTFTRSESLTTAIRHGRDTPAPAVCHGEGSTAIVCATSGGGAAASWTKAISASVLRRNRHDSARCRMFQATIFNMKVMFLESLPAGFRRLGGDLAVKRLSHGLGRNGNSPSGNLVG